MASAAVGSSILPLVGKFRFPCRSIVWVYAAVALLAAIGWQRLAAAPATARGDRRQRAVVCRGRLWPSACSGPDRPSIWPEYVSAWPAILAGPLLFARRRHRACGGRAWLSRRAGGSGVAHHARPGQLWPELCRLAADGAARPNLPARSNAPPNADRPIVAQPDQRRDGPQQLAIVCCWPDSAGPTAMPASFPPGSSTIAILEPCAWPASAFGPTCCGMATKSDRLVAGCRSAAADSAGHPSDRRFSAAIPGRSRGRRRGALQSRDELPAASRRRLLDPRPYAEDLELTPGIARHDHRSRPTPRPVSLSTETHGRQLLVVTASYHSGWQATVDGRPVPVLRVNRDFLDAWSNRARTASRSTSTLLASAWAKSSQLLD